ncbi:O-antigen polymerase [Mycolicibacterium elephantis]
MIYGAIAVGLILIAHSVLPRGYSPGHVWAYAWGFAWICQAILGAGYLLDVRTVVFVSLGNLVFILGAYIGSSGTGPLPTEPPTRDRSQELELSSGIRGAACVACVLLGLVALNSGLKQVGNRGLAGIFSGSFIDFGTSLVETKASFTDEGVYVTPAGITIALVFLTTAAVLAGMECALVRRERWNAAITLVLIVSIFGFITSAGTGVRGYLLTALLLLISAYLATKIFVAGLLFKIPFRAYFIGFIAAAVFLIWVVVVQSVRRGDFSFTRISATLDYLRAWFAGYLPALSQWSYEADLHGGVYHGPVPGVNLLAGVLGNLGVVEGQGITQQVTPVAIGEGSTSNAMTIFRVLLLDFGYPGTLIVCAIAGYVSQRIYLRVLGGAIWAIVPLTAIYAITLYSFDYWFFARGSRIAGVVLAFVVVMVSARIQNRMRCMPSGNLDLKATIMAQSRRI